MCAKIITNLVCIYCKQLVVEIDSKDLRCEECNASFEKNEETNKLEDIDYK